MNPDMLIVTGIPRGQVYPDGKLTPGLWQQGLTQALSAVTASKTRKVVLGDIPITPHMNPNCLARHSGDVRACWGYLDAYYRSMSVAEQAAATATGSDYVNVTPWFCSTTCTDIIDNIVVYKDDDHITATYSRYLETVLAAALGFGPVH